MAKKKIKAAAKEKATGGKPSANVKTPTKAKAPMRAGAAEPSTKKRQAPPPPTKPAPAPTATETQPATAESTPATPQPAASATASAGKSVGKPRPAYANAETMAKAQRSISVSEFFAKNRHLLGFDNPRKALLTTVKEAVDNSLDACEEAGILPKVEIWIEQLAETVYKVIVQDNGPGIVRRRFPTCSASCFTAANSTGCG